ncbi:hypothetical protein HRR83_006629 [Exophiala dermatitidis]|nr:hypothetical protein HRR75_005305 [Exophiala dermatitidis]KAJ4514130.1 hypothetical protein HRR74_005789 [Exophiala dermatitidis]KAJ4515386.1 hypothetical protein HRR73_005217 [Exophiala dermatitidis]KAJ4533778.1 hypothetical protein HRR77_008263 [Exophiala dermatitidis]KAJ4540913.1 hypothetical protein HRR76_004296 [Exophiala dermatitidis]
MALRITSTSKHCPIPASPRIMSHGDLAGDTTPPHDLDIQTSSTSSEDNTAQEPVSMEKIATQPNDVEEPLEVRIERLGRERPPAFKTMWSEVAFVFSIVMSQILTEYFVSGFNVILPTLIVDLNIPQSSSVWPATAFSLVIASTLLVFGRLGDMWGGYPVYLGGLAWLTVWSIICGFSINPLMMDFCRTLQGLGAAAFLPTGVMLMGSVYRPGPRKNLVFALYGTFAVVGFFVGIFTGGIVGQFIQWGWYFWIGAILTAITFATSAVSIPNDRPQRRNNGITMDWLGATTIVSGVVLIVFAITESAHAEKRWRTPYIPTLFCVGCISLLVAVYIEGWVAKMPLLPRDIFHVPNMAQLVIAMFFLYGNVGIFLLYGTQYFQNVMGATPLQVVAWFTPMVLGGLALSTAEGFILHLVPGRLLLIISALGAIGSQLLLALVPVGGSYWAWILPATFLGTVGIDLSYNLITVFITTQLPKARQGLAGGLINSILQLGFAVVLGLCDIIQSYTVEGEGLRKSYKNTFWMGMATSVTSLVLVTIWGRVPKAKSDLTADEKLELAREATRLSGASHP